MFSLKFFFILLIYFQTNIKDISSAKEIYDNKRIEQFHKQSVLKDNNWIIILDKYLEKSAIGEVSLFNYEKLKKNIEDKKVLDNYIVYLENINITGLSRNEAVAYYANLYNAVTVRLITENYPIKSIRKLGPLNSGPWKRKIIKLNDELVSLDDIEHKILRSKYRSPYIHYMLNCASISCPNLQKKAWKGQTLKADQQRAAVEYINSSRGVALKKDGLHLSSIYKWFKEDFKSDVGVLGHILKYANKDLKKAIEKGVKIKSYNYDWTLNDVTDN